MGKTSKGYRIMVSLPPELHERVTKVGETMGLSDSAAVRYLAMRGLEGLLSVIASTQSADVVRSMYQLFETSVEQEKAGKVEDISKGRVLVTPDYSPKNRTGKPERGKKGHA